MAGKITGGMHGVQNYLRVILSPKGEGEQLVFLTGSHRIRY
jgi:hypothetical protein